MVADIDADAARETAAQLAVPQQPGAQ